MQEKEFQKLVEDKCREHKVHFWHVTTKDPGMKGFPDLCIVGTHKLIFRELKRSTFERPAGEQARLLHKLRGAGQDAGVWTPADLADGTIDPELDSLNRS